MSTMNQNAATTKDGYVYEGGYDATRGIPVAKEVVGSYVASDGTYVGPQRIITNDGDLATVGTKADAAWTSGAGTLVAILKSLATVGGTISDAAYAGSGNATLDAVLKGIYSLLSTANTNTAALAKESGGHLASVDTSTATSATNSGSIATNTNNAATVLGTTADAAYAGSGNATLDALLKGVYSLISTTNTNTAHNNAAGTNTSLSSPPANTNAAADTALTFSSAVNHWSLQNNSNQTIYYTLDASTTAANSVVYTLAPGAQIWWDWPVTVLHVYTASAIAVNGAVASSGLVLMGRA